jgi:hypothetical protein
MLPSSGRVARISLLVVAGGSKEGLSLVIYMHSTTAIDKELFSSFRERSIANNLLKSLLKDKCKE